MSIDNGTCHLCFPWYGEIRESDVVILRDVDVVGVGSFRRHQIQEIQKKHLIILETHEDQIPEVVHSIYQTELLQTLHWLRPQSVVPGERLDFLQVQRELFSRIFTQTEKFLGLTAVKMRDQYLEEMNWCSWLLQDHWRYFVGFLRQKFPQNKALLELAHWEWVQAWVEVQPLLTSSSEPGLVTLNPTLQVVTLSESRMELGRDRGLYAVVYNDKAAAVVQRSLDVYEAKILDLLHEDRKYSVEQLVSMASLSEDLETTLKPAEWQNKILSLCADAILEGC